jgi:methionyl aminopeptidase
MIELKSAREVGLMRQAGHILADVMDRLRVGVKPGMSTLEIDEDVEGFIRERGAKPAFKGYRGFPATVCISINEEVVHGIPRRRRRVKEGDIVGLDLGCIVKGITPIVRSRWRSARCRRGFSSCSTSPGEPGARHQECRPGRRLSDVSHAIQQHVESHRFSVVRAFVGHGIGRALHEAPGAELRDPGRGLSCDRGWCWRWSRW